MLRTDLKNGNTELKACVIKEIDFTMSFLGTTQRLIFTYDNRRNPVTATPDEINTGSPKWHFYYDKKGRLITFAGLYNNGGFEFWNNYHYDEWDRVVSDTDYYIGNVGQLPGHAPTYWHTYTYDNLNRIIEGTSANSQMPFFPPQVFDLTYDAAGNLNILSPSYDNKLSPLLTNKIWRFLNVNYSVNNSRPALAYNQYGLPTQFEGGPGDFVNFNLPPADETTIKYDCQGDLPPEK